MCTLSARVTPTFSVCLLRKNQAIALTPPIPLANGSKKRSHYEKISHSIQYRTLLYFSIYEEKQKKTVIRNVNYTKSQPRPTEREFSCRHSNINNKFRPILLFLCSSHFRPTCPEIRTHTKLTQKNHDIEKMIRLVWIWCASDLPLQT